jgi:hypothetical protein
VDNTADEDEMQLGLIAEAAHWRIQLTELGLQAVPDFEAWISDSPATGPLGVESR